VEQGGRPLQKENAAASDNTPSEPCGAATQELAQPKSDQGANRGGGRTAPNSTEQHPSARNTPRRAKNGTPATPRRASRLRLILNPEPTGGGDLRI
jgi:hypothetical protein